ncbi:MAG TPA: zinc-ribbon domain-containing protein [Pyrinomonadaceae bacterium]|nr:zinc-ribbon domain-containing protein [Pyrinomonadaceae bacterium]
MTIIVCQNCAARLQFDEEKAPSRNVSLRCPKCNNTVSATSSSPASEQSAMGASPSTEHPRYDRPTAQAFQLATEKHSLEAVSADAEEALRKLLGLLNRGNADAGQPVRNKRKILVCMTEPHREPIARKLSEDGYQVYIAEDTRQAVETMRANQMEIVLLDPQFDTTEQGALFVVREINILRPPHRRRVFFVLLSPSLRTLDAHAAFLNNCNAVVNVMDLNELPRILDVGLREFNELYREMNGALQLSAL